MFLWNASKFSIFLYVTRIIKISMVQNKINFDVMLEHFIKHKSLIFEGCKVSKKFQNFRFDVIVHYACSKYEIKQDYLFMLMPYWLENVNSNLHK